MQWDRITLGRMAKEMGFVRDTLEKVSRLADVLKFMEEDELLSQSLALKGGTAINLTIFNLPRLSVDIDLDYCKSIERRCIGIVALAWLHWCLVQVKYNRKACHEEQHSYNEQLSLALFASLCLPY